MANDDDVSKGTSPLRRRTLTTHNEATMRTVVERAFRRLFDEGPWRERL